MFFQSKAEIETTKNTHYKQHGASLKNQCGSVSDESFVFAMN